MPLPAGCLEALLQPRRGRGLAEERKGAGFPAGGHMASSPARDENAVGRGSYPSGRGPRPDWRVPWPTPSPQPVPCPVPLPVSLPSPAPRASGAMKTSARQAGRRHRKRHGQSQPGGRLPPRTRRRCARSGPARDLERPGARWNPGAWHRPARDPGHRCAMRPAAPAFFWGGGPQTRKERGGGPRTPNVPAPSRRRKRILRHKRRNPVRLRDAAPPGTGPKSLTGASPDPTLCGGGGTGWPRPPRRAGCSRRRALPGLGGAEML